MTSLCLWEKASLGRSSTSFWCDEGARSRRVMAIALHSFVTGVGFRAQYVEKALAYIVGRPYLWWTTSDGIAHGYYAPYCDEALQS
jgi:hypothetical protein